MFGGVRFGGPAFGQAGTEQAIPLEASARITVATTSTIRAPVMLAAAAAWAIAVETSLHAPGSLGAVSTIGIATTSALALPSPLASTSTIRINSTAPLVQAGPLLAAATIRIQVLSAYGDVVLADDPAAFWRLGEPFGKAVGSMFGAEYFATPPTSAQTTNTAIDETGNGHNGIIAPSVLREQRGPLAESNPAMAFDGATGSILTAGSFALPMYSVEAWIKTSASAGTPDEPYLSTRDGVPHQGGVYFGVKNGRLENLLEGAAPVTSTAVVADDQWHYVVTTYDGATMRLYVDGVADATAARSLAPAQWTNVQIAYDAASNTRWTGTLDEVAIYPSVLTPAQIAAHYARRGVTLATASVTVGAQSSLVVSVTSHISTLPATFSSTAAFRVRSTANVELIGLRATNALITFNGAIATERVRLHTITITDILNEAPNSCRFVVQTQPPSVGTDIKIALQNLAPQNILFGGTVRSVEQSYDLQGANPSWAVDCIDYTFLLNRKRVVGDFSNGATSASAIATSLVQTYAPSFSTAGIVAGLPAIAVTFTGETLMDALTQIANLVGGYTRVDYSRVVWLFVTDPQPPPLPVTGVNPLQLLPAVMRRDDESQIRTRVWVRGKSTQVSGPTESVIPVGSAEIPVEDATMFAAAFGYAIADGRVISYTGTTAGKLVAVVVGNVPGPATGGVPTIAAGVAGRLSGWYQYAIAFANSAGETSVGPPSNRIFCPDFTTPTQGIGIGASPSGTVGPLVGLYRYRLAFLTTLGETLPGPVTERTANALAAPSLSLGFGGGGIARLTPGRYSYRCTYVTQYGETTGGPSVDVQRTAMQSPVAPSVAASAPGVLLPGQTFWYTTTFVTPDGETTAGGATMFQPPALFLPGFTSQSLAGGGILGGPYAYGVSFVTQYGESGINVASVGSNFTVAPAGGPYWNGGQDTAGRMAPGTYYYASSYFSDTYGETTLSPANSVTINAGSLPLRLNIALNTSVGPGLDGLRVYRAVQGGQYTLVAEFRVANGIPGTFWDVLAQGEAGGAWPVNPLRLGVRWQLTLSAANEAGVVARRIYRTKAGGSEYFLVGEVQNNTNGWTFIDGVFDTSLTQRNPVVLTTGRCTVISQIATGPVGTIGRRIYRTKAGGSQYFLVGELKDNSSNASFVDNLPDASLTVALSAQHTAGSEGAATILVLPTGPPGVIARRIYRTGPDGSTYTRLAEIPDNVTQTYTDNAPESTRSGGAGLPPVSTAGGDTHRLTFITGPTGTLARLIYRTTAGGSEYRLLARISDNVTTVFDDAVADANLGTTGVSLVNEAGASAVQLVAIPTGPASVTQRLIFRTAAGGVDFRYVGTIDDNITTTFLDDKADANLGRAPQPTSTIGALVGDTMLQLDAASASFPVPGWVRTDNNQYLRYTGRSGNALTGIPPSGAGAILATIRGGSSVATVPMLIGVTWIGFTADIAVGDALALWVLSDAPAAQAAIAALEGGDGIHEYVVNDSTLDTIAACQKRGAAELTLFQSVQQSFTYTTRDPLTRSGALVHVAMGPPQNHIGDFRIQQVRIDQIDIAERTWPRYTVHASSTKYTLADLLRHVLID